MLWGRTKLQKMFKLSKAKSGICHPNGYKIIVGLCCGFEGRVTTSVEFKSVPRKIFVPSDNFGQMGIFLNFFANFC